MRKKQKCTVLIPAQNESKTIEKCICKFLNLANVLEVIVVANNCDDDTAKVAMAAGAKVIKTKRSGKGNAISIGIKAVKTKITIICDGDLKNPKEEIIIKLLSACSKNTTIVKGYFDRSKHPGPVTDMLVKPILQSFNHPASKLKQPLSGMIAVKTKFLRKIKLPKDFGIDLFIVLMAYKQKLTVTETSLPTIKHRQREWSHYKKMSKQIMGVFKTFGLKFD